MVGEVSEQQGNRDSDTAKTPTHSAILNKPGAEDFQAREKDAQQAAKDPQPEETKAQLGEM